MTIRELREALAGLPANAIVAVLTPTLTGKHFDGREVHGIAFAARNDTLYVYTSHVTEPSARERSH